MRRLGCGSKRAGSSRADRTASPPASSRPSGSRNTAEAAAASRRRAGNGSPPVSSRTAATVCDVPKSMPSARMAATLPPPSGRILQPWATPTPTWTRRRRWPSPTAAAPPRATRTPPRRSPGRSTLGYRYVETDVHATADGVAVVFHDADAGPADRRARAGSRTLRWADLPTVRVGGAAAVPRLDEVLDAWPRRAVQHRRQGRRPASRPRSRRCTAPARATGCCWPRSATPGWPGCARWPGRGWPPRWACAAVARLRLASLTGRPAGAAAVGGGRAGAGPLRAGAGGRPAVRRVRPPARAAGARVDDRRTCRDAASYLISVWMAS